MNLGFLFPTAIPNTTPSQKEGTCPKNSSSFNWFPYGDYCYGLSSYTYETNTWDYAQQACVNAAPGKLSNLVSIHNSLEGRFAGELVLRYVSTSYDSFWIGLRKDSRSEFQCFLCIMVLKQLCKVVIL